MSSATYRDSTGQQWTVDQVAPGGVGSISDTGMVQEAAILTSTALIFRRVPDGKPRYSIRYRAGSAITTASRHTQHSAIVRRSSIGSYRRTVGRRMQPGQKSALCAPESVSRNGEESTG